MELQCFRILRLFAIKTLYGSPEGVGPACVRASHAPTFRRNSTVWELWLPLLVVAATAVVGVLLYYAAKKLLFEGREEDLS
jgi:hypothetical protein